MIHGDQKAGSMNERVKNLLLEANKLIFVKQYGEAEGLIENILRLPEGRNDLLVHMRRVELAAMLGKLPRLRDDYRSDRESKADRSVIATALVMVEQHGEMIEPSDAVQRYQTIIKDHGSHAAAWYGIGFAMEGLGNFDRAIFNYEQAIGVDPGWYPALFGLSQLFYQKGDDKRGDQFFFQFENAAPYNVYGNFETHRKLCMEFIQKERYDSAEAAVTALSSWWLDNKGQCPPEVHVYEGMATARISELQGEKHEAELRGARARATALQILDDTSAEEGVLYFVAKVLEEFGERKLALEFYKKILRQTGRNPQMVQKIGGQFLSQGEYALAKDLFSDAYEANPDHPEIRFCLLVANLKVAGVNVEEYLIGRERLRQLVDSPSDKVELLALLHSLMAKFQGDADVHGHVGDVYLRLGNLSRAATHYRKMFEIDGRSQGTALKYAGWLMQHGDPEEAMDVLGRVNGTTAQQAEIWWLKANYWLRKKQWRSALELLSRALATDPWNVTWLVQEAVALEALHHGEDTSDPALEKLAAGQEGDINWNEFDRRTQELDRLSSHELGYCRRKLRFLYTNGGGETLSAFVKAAAKHDAARGTGDIIRLLNTNFDSPALYWALGMLFKELWQLETATMWFEQALLQNDVPDDIKRRVCLELADCWVWRNHKLPKAIEYAKLAMDMGERSGGRAMTILAHAYLRSGQVRQAQVYLDQADRDQDLEATWLVGLLHYRNGAKSQANKVWKPLLTVRSESLRFHNIKQEILRYYFDGAPYWSKAN